MPTTGLNGMALLAMKDREMISEAIKSLDSRVWELSLQLAMGPSGIKDALRLILVVDTDLAKLRSPFEHKQPIYHLREVPIPLRVVRPYVYKTCEPNPVFLQQ